LVLLFDKIGRGKVHSLTDPLQLHKHAGKTAQGLFIALYLHIYAGALLVGQRLPLIG
jgi:hypothetical protein